MLVRQLVDDRSLDISLTATLEPPANPKPSAGNTGIRRNQPPDSDDPQQDNRHVAQPSVTTPSRYSAGRLCVLDQGTMSRLRRRSLLNRSRAPSFVGLSRLVRAGA